MMNKSQVQTEVVRDTLGPKRSGLSTVPQFHGQANERDQV
jgi:hypothetical protein